MFLGLTTLTSIDLRYNQIEQILSGTFSNMDRLGRLLLNGNKIKELPKCAFFGLSSLKFLDLSENIIKVITDDTFSGLSVLQNLVLHHNELETIE